MSDVSTRAFRFFLALERRGQLDIGALLEGLPVSREELENPRRRVPWDVWAEINERFGRSLHDVAAIERAGENVTEPGYLGALLPIVGVFTDPRDLYRIGLKWFAPATYRNLAFGFEDSKTGPLRVTVEIPAHNRGSEAFMRMTAGGLRVMPRLIGLPPATVEAQIDAHHGRFEVSLPPARSIRSFVARAVATVRGANAISAELADQQAQIADSYAAMARAERGLGSVLEALPVAVGVHRDHRLLYANPALARLVGNADLIGVRLQTLVPEDERPRLDALLRHADPTDVVELRLHGGDAPVFVECGALEGFEFRGEPAGLLFAIDLSARRAAQQALARSEELTRVLLQVLPDLLLRVDRQGTLLDFWAGRQHPEAGMLSALIGHSLLGLAQLIPALPDELIETGMVRVREALDEHRETSFAAQSSVFGPLRHYDCRIFPGDHDDVLVLVRDVTITRQMEQQLALTERMATLGTVAAGVAHELNNPLTYILSNVSLALEELDASGRPLDLSALRQTLRDARDGGLRVQRIVADLGVFSRGGASDEIRPTDVREVLESVFTMTQAEVRARARLVAELERTVAVDAEPARLGQVFVNLLVNAAQAISDGTPAQHQVRVRSWVDDDGWQLVDISDDGVGIAPELLPRVFEPFVTTKSSQGGTGLGLAICHRIVTELGGSIGVESELGVGTRFRVRLPPSARRLPVGGPELAPGPSLRARILLVDDEPLIARVFARSLAQHDVESAASGEEALERLLQARFDLVLCDLTLGGMSGLDLREAVRARDPELAERFLFVSGGALTPAAQDLINHEPERCISKPVSPDDLRARVQLALQRFGA
jgi:signal transduction histidine kinase/CheY-like chemotaxis protein